MQYFLTSTGRAGCYVRKDKFDQRLASARSFAPRTIGARRRARREVALPRGLELPGPEPGALSVEPRKRRHGRHGSDAPLPGWSRGPGHQTTTATRIRD